MMNLYTEVYEYKHGNVYGFMSVKEALGKLKLCIMDGMEDNIELDIGDCLLGCEDK